MRNKDREIPACWGRPSRVQKHTTPSYKNEQFQCDLHERVASYMPRMSDKTCRHSAHQHVTQSLYSSYNAGWNIFNRYLTPITHLLVKQVALLSQTRHTMLHVCLYLTSAVQYLECSLSLVTWPSDLPVYNQILFCSLFFGVFVHAAGCDKQRFTDGLPSLR